MHMRKENLRIDKTIARQFLDRNQNNCRKMTLPHAENLARTMERGEWVESNPTPIVFDKDGNLRNGQHRLMAVILSGATLWFTVVWDADEPYIRSIDEVRPRKIGDSHSFFKTKNQNDICTAIIKALANLQTGFLNNNKLKISTTEAIAVYSDWSTEMDFIVPLVNQCLPLRNAAVSAAVCQYIRKSPIKGRAFCESLYIPEGPVQQARVLRDYLLSNKKLGTSARTKFYENTVWACGCHFLGQEIHHVNKRANWDEVAPELGGAKS